MVEWQAVQCQCKFAMSAASRDPTMTFDFKYVTDVLNLRDSKNFLTFGGYKQQQQFPFGEQLKHSGREEVS